VPMIQFQKLWKIKTCWTDLFHQQFGRVRIKKNHTGNRV
jgi:hypothetical protein